MQSFVQLYAFGRIVVHSSALLGNSKSGKYRGNSSQATLVPCNQCQLPLDTAVALFTVNGSVLDSNPKLGQQLPELGVNELVPVIKTSNAQTFIGCHQEFDGVVPDAKGLAHGRTGLVPQKQ